MADHLRADLDQLLPERGQRPVRHRPWQRQRAHEVGEVVGERVKLKPDLVVAELLAGEARPVDRVLAFLDPLLSFTALIVESRHPFGRAVQVGHDEAIAGDQQARMPLILSPRSSISPV